MAEQFNEALIEPHPSRKHDRRTMTRLSRRISTLVLLAALLAMPLLPAAQLGVATEAPDAPAPLGALPIVEPWTPPAITSSPWLPAPDVDIVGAGSIITHATQVLAWLDVGRTSPRVFDLTYRYLAPGTSLTGEGRIEIGLTPQLGDESEAWVRFDGGLLRSLLGMEATQTPSITIDADHQPGFLVQPLADVTGDLVDDYLARVPHFSTAWFTITEGNKAFHGVWGSSASDVWAVGDHRIYHKDSGPVFQDKTPTALRDNSMGVLNTVVGSGPSLVFAAGDYGKIWKYAGGDPQTGWSPIINPFNLQDPSKLIIQGSTYVDGIFWFVGTDLTNGLCFVGCTAFIGWHNPSTGAWDRTDLDGLEGDLRTIWGQGPFNLWAMGRAADNLQEKSLFLRGDFFWDQVNSDGVPARLGAHGTSSNNMYAVGIGGKVWRYDGFYWMVSVETPDNIIYTVRATHPDVVWAGGCENACKVLHQRVQSTWVDIPVTTTLPVLSMWSSGLKDVWAVGSGGLIMHYVGGPPLPPKLSVPASNAANINPQSVTLTSFATQDPEFDTFTYKFYVSTDYASLQPGATPATPLSCNPASSSCVASNLAGQTHYYWRVDACDGPTSCSSSPVWRFTTASIPKACITVDDPDANDLSTLVDGGCSSSPGGGSLAYDWDWRDGTSHGTAARMSHVYSNQVACPRESFDIKLRVTNSAGAYHEATKTVDLEDGRHQDRDGLVKCQEQLLGTSEVDEDTDDDGLWDFQESEWIDDFYGPDTWDSVFCNGNAACPHKPNPVVRDLYVEVDWMAAYPLSQAVQDAVKANFVPSTANGNNDVKIHLDAGSIGGGGTIIPPKATTDENDIYTHKFDEAYFHQNRLGIYRYGIIACAQTGAPTSGGFGYAPGSTFANFYCPSGMSTDDLRIRALMHEMGHNILGKKVDPVACAGTPYTLAERNPTLDHFNEDLTQVEHPEMYCDGDSTQDAFGHPMNTADVMYPFANQATVSTYATDTWEDLKLDFGIDGTVFGSGCAFPPRPDCVVPSEPGRPCPSPFIGMQPTCIDPPPICAPPSIGTPPNCSGAPASACPLPMVGIWPDCVDPPPSCPADELGIGPVCQAPPADCSQSEGIGAEGACAYLCSPPSVGVVVAGMLRCFSPPEACELPTVGVGSTCVPVPQSCPPGEIGVVWYGVASICQAQPQLCSLPGVGLEPTCITTCGPPQVGLIVGEFVACVPQPQTCPSGSYGIEWDPSFYLSVCLTLCPGGDVGVAGLVCANAHERCVSFPDLATVCASACGPGEVGAEPVCIDIEDPCSLIPPFPLSSSSTLIGIDCVGLCSAPKVGVIVGDWAVCVTPPVLCSNPSVGIQSIACFNRQTWCLNSPLMPDQLCLPNPF